MTTDSEPSAADQYARYRRNKQHPGLAEFASHYDFGLDDF